MYSEKIVLIGSDSALGLAAEETILKYGLVLLRLDKMTDLMSVEEERPPAVVICEVEDSDEPIRTARHGRSGPPSWSWRDRNGTRQTTPRR